jgi:predicted N-formylglutamate amidohydrolase
MVDPPPGVVISCEHAGNGVPPAYRALFRGQRRVLQSHRGWDPGALDLARTLSRALDAPLVAAMVSRLLVEPNRSPGHPRLFSEFTRDLSRDEKDHLRRRYYEPHRGAVAAVVHSTIRAHGRVVHVGVHTFTPVLNGRARTTDIGLLYDPQRRNEAAFCDEWIALLALLAPELRVRRNYPYRGSSDGLTTTLRAALPARRYLGIELEVNQKWVKTKAWQQLRGVLARSLALVAGTAPAT